MPNVPQEPLSPLRFTGLANFYPGPTAPPGTLPVTVGGSVTMQYLGQHNWNATIPHDPVEGTELAILASLFLDWQNSKTSISVSAYAYPQDIYPGDSAYIELGTCDASSPWGTGTQTWSGINGYADGTAAAQRIASALLPIIAMMISSPTVHGPIDGHVIEHGPLYPEGAIYGETPPNGYGTHLRLKAENVIYTDPGHAARRVNFQSAASQWSDLSPAQQADWNAAGRTVKPPQPGYTLWTQIIATRRTDRIPTLNARTGKTLIVPDFPA